MPDDSDVHYRSAELEEYREKLTGADLAKDNFQQILAFDKTNAAEGLSSARRLQYVRLLAHMCGLRCKECGTLKTSVVRKGKFFVCKHKFATTPWLKVLFSKAKKSDIIDLLEEIKKQGFKDWTVQGYKITLKKFYRWLKPQKSAKDYPEEVSWIPTTMKNGKHKLPEELLTVDEISKVIKTTGNVRDKALIGCLYESGCRIGELLTRKVKHVQFDKYGAVLIVDGKTGMRRVRLIYSSPLLASWLETHPARSNPNAPLWISRIGVLKDAKCLNCKYAWKAYEHTRDLRCSKCLSRKVSLGEMSKDYEVLTYKGLYSLFRSLFLRARVMKRFHPHLFRHSRATELANKLTEAQLKEIFGWTQRSAMAATYVHLSGRDIDNALLKLHGLLEESEQDDGSKGIKCPRCKLVNLPKSSLCSNCGLALSEKAAFALREQEKKEKLEFAALILEAAGKIKKGDKITREESVRILETEILKEA